MPMFSLISLQLTGSPSKSLANKASSEGCPDFQQICRESLCEMGGFQILWSLPDSRATTEKNMLYISRLYMTCGPLTYLLFQGGSIFKDLFVICI